MLKKLIILVLVLTLQAQLYAGEGMWLPHLLKLLNEGEMHSLGMKMSAEDIYSVNHGSLKDAIGHFNGGCTSEVISSQGLLLTNHHCGYSQIQSHSTVEDNYLKNGFWAKTQADEKSNPGLYVTFIERIDDVTDIVLEGVKEGINLKERQSIIDRNMKKYRELRDLKSYQEIIIKAFYEGNQYFAFLTKTYNDIRLVGAPPESIGKFGSDTDNWVWPRHSGDFSMFRIYADKDNNPAEYSIDNKPYNPKHFLPVSLDGVEEDDFTLIFGFPGRTHEYLPSVAIEQTINVLNPAKIDIRDKALKIINSYMRKDETTRLQYASKYARVANYWKKWIGERTGMIKTGAVAKKKKFEEEFKQRVKKKFLRKSKYNGLLPAFETEYKDIEEYALVRDYYNEIVWRNVEALKYGSLMKRLVDAYKNNGVEGYNGYKARLLPYLEGNFKNYNPVIDKDVFVSLIQKYIGDLDEKYIPKSLKKIKISKGSIPEFSELVYKSSILDIAKLKDMVNESPEIAVSKIEADPLYKLTDEWSILFKEKVTIPYEEHKGVIDSLQRLYMKAQLEKFPEKRFYPDANSTLRVTYGQVKGYKPRDAVYYTPVTYLTGVMEKYVPEDYEFDVSPKLIELYEKKDYGQYADKTGDLPICFLGTNHTTGGNSGSPTIDANGNLIGLNFDRVWEGTMSDLNYDASICRNIMVDVRYILFVIDKYAGATRLIDEMKLVHPKGN